MRAKRPCPLQRPRRRQQKGKRSRKTTALSRPSSSAARERAAERSRRHERLLSTPRHAYLSLSLSLSPLMTDRTILKAVERESSSMSATTDDPHAGKNWSVQRSMLAIQKIHAPSSAEANTSSRRGSAGRQQQATQSTPVIHAACN